MKFVKLKNKYKSLQTKDGQKNAHNSFCSEYLKHIAVFGGIRFSLNDCFYDIKWNH